MSEIQGERGEVREQGSGMSDIRGEEEREGGGEGEGEGEGENNSIQGLE